MTEPSKHEEMYLRRGTWRKVSLEHAGVDFIVVRFPGTTFPVAVATELKALADAGTIHVIDLLFLIKDEIGNTQVQELTDLDDVLYESWEAAAPDIFGYLTEEDALMLADSLPRNSTAVLALIENTWARKMVSTIADAHGDVLISERIPRPVVEQLVMNH